MAHGQEVNKSSANCDTPKPALVRIKVSQACDWSIGVMMDEETNANKISLGELMIGTIATTDALAKLMIAKGVITRTSSKPS